MKRKMLSTKNSTSWPWSRKYSATVRPERRDAHARARRLVHLAVHEGALGALGRAVVLLGVDVDVRLDHLVIEVVALARALADAGEHRVAAVRLGDVVDQLHDQHGLADAGAAEQADLAALGVGREQVDDLDAGDEDLRFRRLLGEGRAPAAWMARLLAGLDGPGLVDRLADHVDDAPERLVADGHGDRAGRCRVTSWPRTRPSVESMAMVRTVFSPRCWATSSTRRLPWFVRLERVENLPAGARRTARRRRRP